MARKVVTYYFDIIRNIGFADITVHNSGAAAAKYLLANYKKYFNSPAIFKNKIKSPPASIGFFHRGFRCDWLDDVPELKQSLKEKGAI